MGLARMPGNCRDRKFRTYTRINMPSAIQARELGGADCDLDGSSTCPCDPIGDPDVCVAMLTCPASENLEQCRRAHTAAHAHGYNRVLNSPATPFNQRVRGQTIAGHAVRMSDGDGAAIDIEAIIGNAELVAAIDHLHSEGFVQLPEPDIVHVEIEAFQEFGNGENRANSHLVRLCANHGHAAKAAEWLKASGHGQVRFHHD